MLSKSLREMVLRSIASVAAAKAAQATTAAVAAVNNNNSNNQTTTNNNMWLPAIKWVVLCATATAMLLPFALRSAAAQLTWEQIFQSGNNELLGVLAFNVLHCILFPMSLFRFFFRSPMLVASSRNSYQTRRVPPSPARRSADTAATEPAAAVPSSTTTTVPPTAASAVNSVPTAARDTPTNNGNGNNDSTDSINTAGSDLITTDPATPVALEEEPQPSSPMQRVMLLPVIVTESNDEEDSNSDYDDNNNNNAPPSIEDLEHLADARFRASPHRISPSPPEDDIHLNNNSNNNNNNNFINTHNINLNTNSSFGPSLVASARDSRCGSPHTLSSTPAGPTNSNNNNSHQQHSISDMLLYSFLSIGLSTLWPRTYNTRLMCRAHVALVLTLVAHGIFGCGLAVYEIYTSPSLHDSRGFLIAQKVFLAWSPIVGLYFGRSYFNNETSRHGDKCVPELYFWRRVRSDNLDPSEIKLESFMKRFALALLALCALEAVTTARQSEQPAASVQSLLQPVCEAQDGVAFKDGMLLSLQALQWSVLHWSCYSTVILRSVTTVTLMLAGAIVISPTVRRTTLHLVIALFQGLCSYWVLRMMRKFLSAFLCLVVIIDVNVLFRDIQHFQQSANLRRTEAKRRRAQYIALGERLQDLHTRVSSLVHFLVIDLLVFVTLDTISHPRAEAPTQAAAAANASAANPLQSIENISRHGLALFVLTMLWRISATNTLYSQGMLDAINRARFEDSSAVEAQDQIIWKEYVASTRATAGIKLFSFVVGSRELLLGLVTWMLTTLSKQIANFGGPAALVVSMLVSLLPFMK
eukprot:m.142415 g.142415  ORF g.142415 m.142415 type:complete len:811 (-) comp16711_c0_seq3:339-2771(-)